MGFPDLDLFALLAQAQAIIRTGLGQKLTRYLLEDEPVCPALHWVDEAQNLPGFGVNSRFVFGFRISTKGRHRNPVQPGRAGRVPSRPGFGTA